MTPASANFVRLFKSSTDPIEMDRNLDCHRKHRFNFQIFFVGQEKTTVRQEQLYRSSTNDIAGGTSGRLFSFKLIVRQIPSVDGEDYMHIVNSSLVIGRYTTDSRKWNLDNITLYIGGYKQSINSGQNFEGCLSDFMFQGVNIIEAYFQQYPNNTNPVRGRYTSGNFSNMAETCDDSGAVTPITTQPPTSARINGNSGAIGLKVFSFLFLFAFVFMFCVL